MAANPYPYLMFIVHRVLVPPLSVVSKLTFYVVTIHMRIDRNWIWKLSMATTSVLVDSY